MMHPTFCACVALLMAGVLFTSAATAADSPGLRVDENGTIRHHGQPIRAFGVNYMSAFTRCLENPADQSYQEGFQALARHHIPFARLNFGGFYPVDWHLYQEDPDRYFSLLDGVVRAAESAGIGLVPSLFWWSACIPDLMKEPRNQWGNPASKTHAFMRTYTEQVVSRYLDSPAIWAWEFGNEYSLAADLPNAAENRPATPVSRGCPAERSAADDVTSDMINTAVSEFARAVRKIDAHRPITSGHSLPRPSAHHQRVDGNWTQDSVEDFRDNLTYMTPDPADLMSIHVYPHAREHRFGETTVDYARILGTSVVAARDAGKGLFLGEFGPPPDNEAPWTVATAKEEGLSLLRAVEESAVQLAAFWVFDFPWQEKSMNVSPDNHRAHYLYALEAANRRVSTMP